MMRHLNQEQITEAVLGMLLPDQKEHLEQCTECQTEVEKACTELAEMKQHARTVAERPEAFWAWQRLAIAHRIDKHLRRHNLRWAWAMATAAVMAFGIWSGLGVLRNDHPHAYPKVAQTLQPDPDEALLTNVQLALNQDVPVALEPATVLASEVRQSISKSGSSTESDRKRRIQQ